MRRFTRWSLLLPVVLAVALLGAGAPAFAQDAPAPGDIVVNEVLYDPPTGSDPGEYVELLNRSGQTFDLSQFSLADSRGEPVPVASEPAELAPGEYAVLVQDGEAFQSVFPSVSFVEPGSWPQLNNGGDRPALLYEGDVIDAVPYTPGWGGDNVALERIDPAGPSDAASNFGSSTAEVGTPGAQNTIYARDAEAPRLVFAREVRETENTFAADFSEPLAPVSVAASGFTVGGQQPASAEITDDGTRVRLAFGSAPGGTRLTARGMADRTGNTLDEASVEIAFVAQPFDGRPPGNLVVNEILYDPLSDDFDERPNQPEYVELYNPTGRRLALEGYFLTDRPDEEGEVNRIGIGQPQAFILPEGFAVAYAAEGGALKEAFPETDFSSESVTLLPVERSTLGLVNGGDLVALRRPDSALVDSVFYRPEWQSEAVESGDGRALERIDPLGPSGNAANWTTSTAERGGTPGRPNRAAPPPGGPPDETGVEVTPSPFSPDGDGLDDVAFIRYTLDAPVSLARVRIYDAMGREVYAREAELAGREGQIPWKGRSDAGDRLRMGIYVVLFEALDADGGAVRAFKEPVVLARPLD